MKTRIKTILLLLVIFSTIFSSKAQASSRLYSENFDDRNIDQPTTGTISVINCTLDPGCDSGGCYNYDRVGYSGSGYALSSCSIAGGSGELPILMWAYGQDWPTDELYYTFYYRWIDMNCGVTADNENLKLTYPHFVCDNDIDAYYHIVEYGCNGLFQSIRRCDGNMVSGINYGFTPQNRQTDGLWHKWEFRIKFSTAEVWVWMDGVLLKYTDAPDDSWEYPMYVNYITFGSQNAVGGDCNATSRQIDDVEVWDGLPDVETTAPAAPSGLSVQ